MATARGNHRRPIDPYYDLTHETGRLNFHRLFNEELTTMGNHRRLMRSKDVRFFAVYDFEYYYKEEACRDVMIPYMAVTFFDRFLSKERIPKITNQRGNDRRLFISCCLTLSWKLRDNTFLASTFLEKYNLLFPGEQLYAMESHICRVLDWRFKTLTPFRFLDFFEPFVTLPPREAPLRPVYKLLLKCQYDVEFTKFRPSIMAASALLVFISNELPNTLSDFESNLIRGFFDPEFQGKIKECEMKLAPLYGGLPSGATDSAPRPVGAATSSSGVGDQGAAPSSSGVGDQGAAPSSSGVGDQGAATSSSGVGNQEEPGTSRREGDDDDAHTEDRGLFGIELEWHLGLKNFRDDVPKRCGIL